MWVLECGIYTCCSCLLGCLSMEMEEPEEKPKKEIRIWMDGAFDMMHYGHMNAFRQGKGTWNVSRCGCE